MESEEGLFHCSIYQCMIPCFITFLCSLILYIIIAIVFYFKLLNNAKKKFNRND